MRRHFWLIIVLTAGLALLSVKSDTGTAFCDRCTQAILPELDPLFSPVAKLKLPYTPPPDAEDWKPLPPEQRLDNVRSRLLPQLPQELARHDLDLGTPAFIRIFKESRELELWLQGKDRWQLYRTYPVAAMSGTLGPKLKEGDGQAPEGLYSVTAKALNPGSSYHLSFNLGYPNAYDRHHGRTGSFLMVHGAAVSIGCFAMTDSVIEEIYLIVEAALAKGQTEVPVHIYPFRLTPERLGQEEKGTSPWMAFWRELQPIHDAFEKRQVPPPTTVKDGKYVLAQP